MQSSKSTTYTGDSSAVVHSWPEDAPYTEFINAKKCHVLKIGVLKETTCKLRSLNSGGNMDLFEVERGVCMCVCVWPAS